MLITSRKVQVLSIPHKGNEFLAVCEVCLTSSTGQIVCAVGDAQGKNETEIKGLIQQAEDFAHARAILLLESHTFKIDDNTSACLKWSDESPLSTKNFLKNIPNVKNAGGGNNPASPKQIDLITKLCQAQGEDVETFVFKECKTDLNKLIGSQADKIIKKLTL